MLVYPDGRKAWPLLGDMYYVEIPDIRQFQIVQHGVDDVEIKVVADRRLTQAEETQLGTWFHYRSGHAFPVRITYHAENPRGDRKSTRLNYSHYSASRITSSACKK